MNAVDKHKWKKQSGETLARSLDTHNYSAAVSLQAFSSFSRNKCRALWTKQWLFSGVTVLANARTCEVEHSQRSWWLSWSQNQKQTSPNDGIPLGRGSGTVANSANMMEIWKYFSVIFNCFQLESPGANVACVLIHCFEYWVSVIELYRHYSVSRSKCKRVVRFFSLLQYMNLGLTLVTVGVKDVILGQIQR